MRRFAVPIILFSVILMGCSGGMNSIRQTLGFGGGFYTLHEVNVQPSSEAGVKEQKAPIKWPYLTVTIYIDDSAFSIPDFRASRNSSLSHLLLYASFTHPQLQGEKSIPLLLIDLEGHKTKKTNGADLISKFPILPEGRQKSFLEFKSLAVEKSKADEMLRTWENINNKYMKQIPLLPAASVIQTLNTVTAVLDNLPKSKGFEYNISQPIPTQLENSDTQTLVYIIVPTDQDNILSQYSSQLELEDLTVDKNKKLYHENTPYKTLPYIVVDYKFDRYVTELGLLPPVISSDCSNIDKKATENATENLQTARSWLSPEQLAIEKNLISMAEKLQLLKSQAQQAELVDTYMDFSTAIDPSTKSIHHSIQDRVDTMTSCANNVLAGRVPIPKSVIEAVKVINKVGDLNLYRSDNEEELEEMAFVLKSFKTRKDLDYGSFIKNTRLYNQADSVYRTIEARLYQGFYAGKIAELREMILKTDESEELKKSLRKKALFTSCDRCKDEVERAVKVYNKNVKTSQKEQQRMTVINEAATKRHQLAAVASVIDNTYEKGRLEDRIKAMDSLLVQVNDNPEGAISGLRMEIQQADLLLKELRPQPVDRIVITADHPSIRVGQTLVLNVRLWDKRGRPVSGRLVTWSSSDESIALVSPSGEVTGISSGRANIFAYSEGNSSSTSIQVKPAPAVASLSISPDFVNIKPGEEMQLTVEAIDTDGTRVSGKTITWSIKDSTIAVMSDSGVVTGLSRGQTTVSATVDGITKEISVSVNDDTGGY